MGLKGQLIGNPARRARTFMLGAIALSTAALTMVGTSSLAGASYPTGGQKQAGGTVRWAEPPGTPPTYIFPFMAPADSSVSNANGFQWMMYRPLYMFGGPQTDSAALNPGLSLASPPVYGNGNTTVTINMKNYKWSNGETVTATDVAFFMNMLHAESSNWYDYTPGYIPDDIKSVTVSSPTTVVFTMNAPISPSWFTYNQASQITPFPLAWDVTATGAASASGGCSGGAWAAAATDAACTKVYNFLNGLAGNVSGYATSPIWNIVDGPYTINAAKGGSFDASGQTTMVPNTLYSGPQKATVTVQQLPFTTDDAVFNALLGGSLDVGYMPPQDVTKATTNATQPGPNNPKLSGFYLSPWINLSFNYGVWKLKSTGDNGEAGPILSQLYVRQAMQSMVDQPAMIQKFLKGYGVPTYGPVPLLPKNNFIDKYEQSNPYPYNPAHAKALMTSHGWKTVGGVDTCEKPGTGSGQCGAGIAKGAQANFSFVYASGTEWQKQVAQVEQAGWTSIGIKTSLTAETFPTVISGYAAPCQSGQPCTTELGWWGGGWEYTPDFYPSGEALFQTGAGSDASNYSNAKADSLIKATTNSTANLNAYQDYMAQQLPFLWQPNADYELSEIANNLRGIAPQNPFDILFAEYWYYVK